MEERARHRLSARQRSLGCGLAAALAVVSASTGEAETRSAPRADTPSRGLEITVSGPGAKPVENAVVVALPASGAYRRVGGGIAAEAVRSTLTDREGKARLEPVPPGPWSVVVQARGFVPRRLARVGAGPLAVRLERGGSITGSVRDSRGKRPLAGVRVAVAGVAPASGGFEEQATRNETTTDGQGRFRLEGIGRTPVRVTARAAGFDTAEREARAGERVELFLFPGATLAGTVVDDDGRPLAGALVRAEGDRPSRVPLVERTDARGAFAIAGIRPGAYTVVAREGGRAPGIAVAVIEPEAEARVVVVVSEGGFVTGRVVDPEARPLAGRLRVEAVDGHALPPSLSELMGASARADGSFTLGPLPPGTLAIAVSAPRRGSRRVEAAVNRRAAADLGDLVLETGLAIRGQVRDEQGNGIEGAAVRGRLRASGERSQAEVTSEADGTYVLAGLRAGTYELRAEASGFAPVRATAAAGGEPVDLVMRAGGQIAGRVVDASGQAVEDAAVDAQSADALDATGSLGGAATSDEGDGRFVVRDLPPGSYALRAVASGRGEASLADVRVLAGRSSEVGTLRLAAGGVVRGSVVDAGGDGVAGATVAADRDPSVRTGEHVDATGSNGSFEIRGVPPGRFSVTASHPAFAPARAAIVEVDPEQEPSPVRIVLAAGARIEGRALRRDGRPLANGLVRCMSFESGPAEGWMGPSPVGADGWFAIDHLVAGQTRVDLLAAMAPGSLGVLASREASLRDGETATIDFSLRDVVVAGSVTRGGQPAPGVRVRMRSLEAGGAFFGGFSARPLEPAPGPPFLAATTREDGRYELVVFAPGRVRVELDSIATNERHPGRDVEVPDVDRFELDLEIAATTVSGVVVAADSGEPVPDARVWVGRASGRSGPDGRFSIGAEPGDQQLVVEASGRKRATLPIDVPPEGVSDLRVELERGAGVRGRVVDAGGRPMPAVAVLALEEPAAGEVTITDYVETLADGSFRFEGLGSQPVALVAGGELPGWAVRGGVAPGGEPLTLVLRVGGRVAVRVRGPDGQPVKGASPQVRRVAGVPFESPFGWSWTDADGVAEVAAPAGLVEVEARAGPEPGRGSITVKPGETVPLEIVLPVVAGPKAP